MVEDDYVELEMDELNQHECMANMIALLKHMQRAKIIPLVESVSMHAIQDFVTPTEVIQGLVIRTTTVVL